MGVKITVTVTARKDMNMTISFFLLLGLDEFVLFYFIL